jgi:hypothetical protein
MKVKQTLMMIAVKRLRFAAHDETCKEKDNENVAD